MDDCSYIEGRANYRRTRRSTR
jgi:uncharacterized protein YndB with AHSA1/START domain